MSGEASVPDAPFSLEDWYANLAPLDEVQRLSVSRVSAWSSEQKEQAEEQADERRPPTPTLSAFLDSLAAEIDGVEDTRYDAEISVLQNTIGELDALLNAIRAVQTNMKELHDGLAFVETDAQELLEQAEGMMKDHTKLEELHKQISLRLSYFAVLPQATSLASSSSLDVIQQPAFLDMLKRLELALQFMNTHSHYTEAHLYQMRMGHCVVRMMDLVRVQFTKHGADCTDKGLARLPEANHIRDFTSDTGTLDLDSDLVNEALYGDFKALQHTYRPLFAQIETLEEPMRTSTSAVLDDYREMTTQCHATFVRWRSALVKELLRMFLNDHALRMEKESELPLQMSAAQAAAFVHGVSCQEVALYSAFFHIVVDSRKEVLASPLAHLLHEVGEQLWTFLATKLAVNASIGAISELCTLFQTIPAPTGRSAHFPSRDEATLDLAQQHQLALLWTQPVLQELCKRLVQKAQVTLKTDIVNFAPSQNDLMYPRCLADQREVLGQEQAALAKATHEKLMRHSKRASVVRAGLLESLVSTEEKTTSLFAKPAPAVYSSWYAPVRTALDLLATLHTHIPLALLTELGVQIIEAAQAAVQRAATLLQEGKFGSEDGGVGTADGVLFQMRHLFVLQELYYSLDIASRSAQSQAANDPSQMQLTTQERHLFGVKVADPKIILDTINSVWSASNFFSRGVSQTQSTLETGASGGTKQSPLDASRLQLEKNMVDTSRRTSELFASNLAFPLQIFMAQSNQQPNTISETKALAAYTTFKQSLDVNLDEMRDKLSLYINDETIATNILDSAIVRQSTNPRL